MSKSKLNQNIIINDESAIRELLSTIDFGLSESEKARLNLIAATYDTNEEIYQLSEFRLNTKANKALKALPLLKQLTAIKTDLEIQLAENNVKPIGSDNFSPAICKQLAEKKLESIKDAIEMTHAIIHDRTCSSKTAEETFKAFEKPIARMAAHNPLNHKEIEQFEKRIEHVAKEGKTNAQTKKKIFHAAWGIGGGFFVATLTLMSAPISLPTVAIALAGAGIAGSLMFLCGYYQNPNIFRPKPDPVPLKQTVDAKDSVISFGNFFYVATRLNAIEKQQQKPIDPIVSSTFARVEFP
ncbi:MAG: hypothetical protein HKM04_05465 [Legionellales bacterium]|nr:hypothetical protein [Legionellales bacterium]